MFNINTKYKWWCMDSILKTNKWYIKIVDLEISIPKSWNFENKGTKIAIIFCLSFLYFLCMFIFNVILICQFINIYERWKLNLDHHNLSALHKSYVMRTLTLLLKIFFFFFTKTLLFKINYVIKLASKLSLSMSLVFKLHEIHQFIIFFINFFLC